MTDYSGFGQLGAALGGMGRPDMDAYNKGAAGAASLETALANARIKRDEAQAREGRRAALNEMFKANPEVATLVDALVGSGGGQDFNQSMDGLGRLQTNRMTSDNYQMAQDPNTSYDMLARLISATSGKPLTADNVGIPEQSRANIGSTNAQANQRNAAAYSSMQAGGLHAATAAEVPATQESIRNRNNSAADYDSTRSVEVPANAAAYRAGQYGEASGEQTLAGAAAGKPDTQPSAAGLARLKALKPGQALELPNGEVWKMVNGKPRRISR